MYVSCGWTLYKKSSNGGNIRVGSFTFDPPETHSCPLDPPSHVPLLNDGEKDHYGGGREGSKNPPGTRDRGNYTSRPHHRELKT